jgi:hypothetical protein
MRGSVSPIGISKLLLTCTTRPSPTSAGEENPEMNARREEEEKRILESESERENKNNKI